MGQLKPQNSASSQKGGGVVRGFRAVAFNILIPVALAWLLADILRRPKVPGVADQAPKGESFGEVRMRVKLPGTNGGIPEPIIVCGVPERASLVFIRLMSHARARVGVEFWGNGKFEGEIFDLPSADATLDIACSLPAFFPTVGDPRWGNVPQSVQKLRNTEYLVTVNGTDRLEGRISYGQPANLPIYFGANPVGGSFVSNLFTGRILITSQAFKEPSLVAQAPHGDSFGEIRMRVRLPQAHGGIPEPIVVCGVPGSATLVYVRLLDTARAKVGVEFWSRGAFESEPFELPTANAQIDITCDFPALFPGVGDRAWGEVPPAVQRQRNSEYLVTVNGVNRLQGRMDYGQPKHARLYFGANPIGGSVVSDLFTGSILRVTQAFPAGSNPPR